MVYVALVAILFRSSNSKIPISRIINGALTNTSYKCYLQMLADPERQILVLEY